MLSWGGRPSSLSPVSASGEDDGAISSSNNSSNNNTNNPAMTKLSAKAANSLREKRRGNATMPGSPIAAGGDEQQQLTSASSSRPSSPCVNANEGDDSVAGEEASSRSSKVFSFFNPQDLRKPAANNNSSSSTTTMTTPMNRPPPSPSTVVEVVAPATTDKVSITSSDSNNNSNNNHNPISGDDDATSVATKRISNHHTTNNISSPSSSTHPTVATHNEFQYPRNNNNNKNNNILSPTSSARAFLATVDVPKEVKYEEGGTELFMLVEDAKWEDVCSRIEYDPSEARVWVISSGTENTVFSWSVWRRLPLHEACRRQPPPVVIYALLAAYPESAMEENNFAELPLHTAVRCGACAEVVNCILAAYPAAAVARDNSGCTPLDILNGIGKMMDHDAVVAALNRAIAVRTRETKMWEEKITLMQLEFQQLKDKQKWEYERILAEKKVMIENLERSSEQERLATSNLAVKVIQTEQVVQEKQKAEKRYLEKMKKYEEEVTVLKSSNGSRKSRIIELEDTVRSNSQTIMELNNRIQSLQSSLVSLVQDEEAFAATKLTNAAKNFKSLVESHLVFLREAEGRKESIRVKVKQLGINIPPKVKSEVLPVGEKNEEEMRKKMLVKMPVVEEVSNKEVAEKALASAMAQLAPFVDEEA